MEKEKEKKTQQEAAPRTYDISSVQLMEIMRYLMTRPYGEVVKLMNLLSTLKPQAIEGVTDVRKK